MGYACGAQETILPLKIEQASTIKGVDRAKWTRPGIQIWGAIWCNKSRKEALGSSCAPGPPLSLRAIIPWSYTNFPGRYFGAYSLLWNRWCERPPVACPRVETVPPTPGTEYSTQLSNNSPKRNCMSSIACPLIQIPRGPVSANFIVHIFQGHVWRSLLMRAQLFLLPLVHNYFQAFYESSCFKSMLSTRLCSTDTFVLYINSRLHCCCP